MTNSKSVDNCGLMMAKTNSTYKGQLVSVPAECPACRPTNSVSKHYSKNLWRFAGVFNRPIKQLHYQRIYGFKYATAKKKQTHTHTPF